MNELLRMTSNTKRSGFLAAGNWIIDQVKIVDCYPKEESLALVLEEQPSNGGSPYNLLKDLRRLGVTAPLQGAGLLAEDELGRSIRTDCEKENIDASRFHWTRSAPTSYTDVFSVSSTGRRTFFHQKGTNALLEAQHCSLESTAKIFHLGYLMLLDRLDQIDDDGRTGASRLLEMAVEKGFIVSADVVSSGSEKFARIVRPSLPFIDVFFANDLEVESISGIEVRRDGKLLPEGVKAAGRWLIENGVRRWACIHFPEGGLVCGSDGKAFWQGSVKVPADRIAGSVGAGDAFAAGMLFGIHEEWEIEKCLRLAVCSAASCLFHPASSLGILPWEECVSLGEEWGFVEPSGA